jgi:hypothetical protein
MPTYRKLGSIKLQEAIARLPIPVLWVRLGLPGSAKNNCCIRSPLRDDDTRASFSIYAEGTRWKDHATGQGGDSFDLFQAVKKMDGKTAYRPFLQLAGITR